MTNRKRLGTPSMLFLLAWTIYFVILWARQLVILPNGALSSSNENMWGDWAVHFTMGSAMAYRQLFLKQSPLILGASFHYPFLANWISAVLIRCRVPFFQAFIWPSALCSIVLVFALYGLYRLVFKSPRAAMLGTCVFLFNGGWGFTKLIDALGHYKYPLSLILNPPFSVTHVEEQGLYWTSVIDTMIVPQRAFNLGFPWAIILLSLVIMSFGLFGSARRTPTVRRCVALGVAWGMLVIAHSHSFLAVSVIFLFLCIADLISSGDLNIRFARWTMMAVTACVVGFPLATRYVIGGDSHLNARFLPGWYAHELNINWFSFWWSNWGITPIVALIGALFFSEEKRNTRDKVAALVSGGGFIFLFVLLNLYVLQPWIWDNTKLLVWVSLGVSGLAGYAVDVFLSWAQSRRSTTKRMATITLAIACTVLMVLSGFIDAYRLIKPERESHGLYSAEELSLADWVRSNTDPQSVWLTGNYHNEWLFNLTGRQAVLTYPGWLWTHGYPYQDTQNDVASMFSHPADNRLFHDYGVQYVVVGPTERATLSAKDESFASLGFSVIRQTPKYAIYRVPDSMR